MTTQTPISAQPQSTAARSMTTDLKNYLNDFLGSWQSHLGILALGIFLLSLVNLNSTSSTASQDQSLEISLGEDLLFQDSTTKAKKTAIKAFAQGDYLSAIQNFQLSLLQQPDDPESLVYLNNARSRLKADPNPLRIAVSLPVGKNPAIAAEMLRGIAQAQDKARELGINGIPLEIVIANDNNDIATAQEIAPILAADPMILAVIGSNASGPSLSSAPIYQQTRIVMISPTSFSGDLSGFGDYIFRTIPNISSQVKTLANYAVNQSKKQRFLICSDTGAMDNQIFQQEFTQAVISLNVEVLPIACDIAQPSFDAAATLKQAISQGADALLIAPHVDYPERGIQLAQAAQDKLALFASPTLYNSTLLSAASNNNNNLKNLVIAAPWYADSNSTTSFLAQAQQRWGDTSLTWRTATSFDATMAIASALGQIPPEQPWGRSQLQQQLRSPGFKAQGAGETVQFLPTGDRAGKAILYSGPQKLDRVLSSETP